MRSLNSANGFLTIQHYDEKTYLSIGVRFLDECNGPGGTSDLD